MSKNNKLSVLSLVIALISVIATLIIPENNLIIIGAPVCIIIAIVSIVLGFKGKKQIIDSNEKGKGLALAGIIIGFITIIWAGLGLIGILAIKNINFTDEALCPMDNLVKDCIDNKDGTSTCKYMEQLEIPCSTDKLKNSQFKK